MKSVAYIRVSSREQSEGYSLDAQENRIEEYALRKNLSLQKMWKVTEKASKEGRIAFSNMVEFVKKNDVKTVVLEKIDRAARNFKDVVTIYDLMEYHDVTFHFVRENIELNKNSTSNEKLQFDIQAVMAKNYVNNLKDEVKKGFEGKVQSGGWPSKAPLGYTNDKNTRGIMVDQATAPFIVKAFELYTTGLFSIEVITKLLHEEGLTNSVGNNKKLSKSRMHVILQNPFYIGKMSWKGQVYEGTHQPLISDELFLKVQKRMEEKSRPKEFKHKFLFNNMIKCGVCGSTYTAEIKKGKYIYYRCTENNNKHSHKYWREEKIEAEIIKLLDKFIIPQDILEIVIATLKDSHQNQIEYHQNAINSLQRNLTKVQTMKDQLYDDKLEGLITKEQYLQKSEGYIEKEEKLLKDIKKHKEANNKYFQAGTMIIELLQNASVLYSKALKEEKREILKFLFSNLTITDERLGWIMNKPFNDILKPTIRSEWSERRDSNPQPRAPKARILAN